MTHLKIPPNATCCADHAQVAETRAAAVRKGDGFMLAVTDVAVGRTPDYLERPALLRYGIDADYRGAQFRALALIAANVKEYLK